MQARDRQLWLFTVAIVYVLAAVMALQFQHVGSSWMLVLVCPILFLPFGLRH